jgi:hypothetical protein
VREAGPERPWDEADEFAAGCVCERSKAKGEPPLLVTGTFGRDCCSFLKLAYLGQGLLIQPLKPDRAVVPRGG